MPNKSDAKRNRRVGYFIANRRAHNCVGYRHHEKIIQELWQEWHLSCNKVISSLNSFHGQIFNYNSNLLR